MSRTYVLMVLHGLQEQSLAGPETGFEIHHSLPGAFLEPGYRLYPQYMATFNHCVGEGKFRSPDKHLRFMKMASHVTMAIHPTGALYAGSALLIGVDPECHIEYVMTSPQFRNQGVATAVMRSALFLAQQRRFLCARLTCSPKLEPFYKKFGFVREYTYEVS